LTALLPLAAAVGGRPDVLDPKGEGARVLGQEITFQIVAGSLVFLLVAGLLIAIVIRQSRRPSSGPPITDDDAGRRWIWLGGLVLPLVVLTGVVAFSARSLVLLSEAGEPPVGHVEVMSHRWWWEVRYPGAAVRTANEVVVPVGQTVRVSVRTDDVIHSFWIPDLQRKVDAIPGRTNHVDVTAEHPGTYRGECAEFCGLQHANMAFSVRALAPGEFRDWLGEQRKEAARPTTASERAGRRLFTDAACSACHRIAGTRADGEIGPDLTHLASRPTIGAGVLENRRGLLATWISDPQHSKRGAQMPSTQLAPDRMRELLDYLERLR
jgi:cytochrome c oxidase subunit 2